MRPISRQSARLAYTTKERCPSALRKRTSHSRRAFHTPPPRQQEGRPPNSNPDSQAPCNEWREHGKRSDSSVQHQEQVSQQDNAESQTSTEGRKYGIRRTLRQKRMNDVPKPPPLPKWFLQRNVKLHKDPHSSDVERETWPLLRCVDTETNHALFTIPRYSPVVEHQHRSSRRKQEDVNQEGAEAASKRREDGEQHRSDGSREERKSGLKAARRKAEESHEQSFKDFFNPRWSAQNAFPRPDPTQSDPKKPVSGDEFHPLDLQSAKSDLNLMRWPFFEAETSLRAAFSLADGSHRTSSFATDRLDLSLQCPDNQSHHEMDEMVNDLARNLQADLIRLDVNDFAELAEDYVGQGHDEPGSYSTLGYDVYDSYAAESTRPSPFRPAAEEEENEIDEDEDAEEDEDHRERRSDVLSNIRDVTKALRAHDYQFGNALGALRARVVGIGIGIPRQTPTPQQRPSTQNSEMTRDDARLAALLENVLDAPKQVRNTDAPSREGQVSQDQKIIASFNEGPRAPEPTRAMIESLKKAGTSQRAPSKKDSGISSNSKGRSAVAKDDAVDEERYREHLRYQRADPVLWQAEAAELVVGYVGSAGRAPRAEQTRVALANGPRPSAVQERGKADEWSRTIVHIRDLADICETRLGDTIIQRLVKVVRKRRRAGHQITIVGTTSQDVPGPLRMPGDHGDFPFRSLAVPPFFNLTAQEDDEFASLARVSQHQTSSQTGSRRIREINLRHMQSMLRKMRPDDIVDLLSQTAESQLDLPGMDFLSHRVLSLDQVQRLTLMAVGMAQSHALSDVVQPIHISLAGFVMNNSANAERLWFDYKAERQRKKSASASDNEGSKIGRMAASGEARMDWLKKLCNAHEARLLSGMVDAQNIKTGFADVHAPIETIDALKTLTTMSLLRPEAFKYGVLANDRLPGLLLYGPPGTGKTLLAKAVAKESRATVLEVSGAQIYEKYVGEGEKMVRAVFSLAKKLSPCIVFIDEADAIFGSRSNAGNRNTHREIINQFLREWDGMDDHAVFMMVASNRPFDLDDAVLRRLPRRLLVDLPVAKDRESILGIHLKNEVLDASVSLSKLAEQTPLYSGSDLKNVAVAAALACVREENESAAAHKDDEEFKLPDKRTLTSKHFEKALAEISASISEDMSSLSAIRKFDEQYGDRRGRRKKTGYGFGASDGIVDEGAARVRQPTSSTPPP